MNTTPSARERAAANQLAEALIEFVMAVESGIVERTKTRPPTEVRVAVQYPPNPVQPAVAPIEEPATEDPERLVGAKEVSEMLGISTRKAWQITAPRGPLKSVRIGRSVKYRVGDVRDYVWRNTAKPNHLVR